MKPKVKKPTEKEQQEAESWPIWEKEECEFPWEYDMQETCLILEGKAVIQTPEVPLSSVQAITWCSPKVSSALGKSKRK
jgi:uncharacterized cupin superfamily protein